MKVDFIGQGLQGGSSIGNALLEAFQNNEYVQFTAFVAFVGTTGVSALQEAIQEAKSHIREWQIFVGVDQRGTSKEALKTLLELDIGTSVYYTRSSVTYHPKVYLFEGENESLAIIGSSNFTGRGLFGNIEASAIIKIERGDDEGNEFIQQTKHTSAQKTWS